MARRKESRRVRSLSENPAPTHWRYRATRQQEERLPTGGSSRFSMRRRARPGLGFGLGFALCLEDRVEVDGIKHDRREARPHHGIRDDLPHIGIEDVRAGDAQNRIEFALRHVANLKYA